MTLDILQVRNNSLWPGRVSREDVYVRNYQSSDNESSPLHLMRVGYEDREEGPQTAKGGGWRGRESSQSCAAVERAGAGR